MTLFQLISLAFLSVLLYRQVVSLRGQPLVKKLFSFRWSFFTVVAILVIWDPGISSAIADFFGIGRGVDIIIYSSVIWLFYQNFRLQSELDNTKRKFEDLVRQVALNNEKKD